MTRQRKEHKFINDIEHKYCSKCNDGAGDWKSVGDFATSTSKWDRLQCTCRDCVSSQRFKYIKYSDNGAWRHEYKIIDGKQYKHCGTCDGSSGSWKLLSCFGKRSSAWDKLHNNCKDCANRQNIEYRSKDDSKNKRRVYFTKYSQERRDTDLLYKFTLNIRNLVIGSITRQGYKKDSQTRQILGADFDTVYTRLKQTFKSNYNLKWDDKYLDLLHIDHIKPLDIAKTEQGVIDLNHHSNLQYLWSRHNLEKSSKTNWILTPDMVIQFHKQVGK